MLGDERRVQPAAPDEHRHAVRRQLERRWSALHLPCRRVGHAELALARAAIEVGRHRVVRHSRHRHAGGVHAASSDRLHRERLLAAADGGRRRHEHGVHASRGLRARLDRHVELALLGAAEATRPQVAVDNHRVVEAAAHHQRAAMRTHLQHQPGMHLVSKVLVAQRAAAAVAPGVEVVALSHHLLLGLKVPVRGARARRDGRARGGAPARYAGACRHADARRAGRHPTKLLQNLKTAIFCLPK